MSYKIYFEDPANKDSGYNYGSINDQEGVRVVNGQGRPFVQLEDRKGEVFIAVSRIYKIEGGTTENKPASAYRS